MAMPAVDLLDGHRTSWAVGSRADLYAGCAWKCGDLCDSSLGNHSDNESDSKADSLTSAENVFEYHSAKYTARLSGGEADPAREM